MSSFINKSSFIIRGIKGFTLMEILISIALLSIVLLAIYSTFFLTHKAVTDIDKTMLKIQEARRALDIFKCELDSIYYDGDEKTLLKIEDRDFYGKQVSQISFTTFSVLRPGLSKISYFVENNDGKMNLFKKVESLYVDENTNESVDIIEDIESFIIEAMYDGKWLKIWDTDIYRSIPNEIKITISFKTKGRFITLFDISTPKIGRNI